MMMNKYDKFFIKYVIYTLPAVLILLVWGSFGDPNELSKSSGIIRLVWDTFGWILMIWVVVSFYLSVRTVFSTKFREVVLSRMTKIKERDEREEEISGHAAKFSFFSTMAVLLLFFFLSIFTVTIGRLPETNIENDKTGYISLNMSFEPYRLEKSRLSRKTKRGETIISYNDLPLTNAGLLLILILWQIGSYHLVAQRELRS